MKLLCAVLEAQDKGDKLRLKLQGYGVGESPQHSRWVEQELLVPMTARNRRTFYVGRQVTIEVKPR